tara:strand:- start:238 stop:1113 length:876 start_codon:yes stop_codon:yes gene_type:complete
MSRIAYVNGQYIPLNRAQVSLQDRGYHFADGVYEVIALYQNKLLDAEGHLARLERSCGELAIAMPCSRNALMVHIRELIRRNHAQNGLIYMQVTRGVAPRKHLWKGVLTPSFSMVVYPAFYPTETALNTGVKVITTTDQRWGRCDIKTIGLLPNVLAKLKAQEAGVYEAWQINTKGEVTEGSLSNSYIVKGDVIYTHPKDNHILGGITRDTTLRLAQERQLRVEERAFSLDDIREADEAFLTSASSFVMPVVQVDDIPIGDGKVGSVTRKLIEAYYDDIASQPALPGTALS